MTSMADSEEPLTVSVLGHQVVRSAEAHGLLLRTQECGDIVFSLPPGILRRLIADLIHLVDSPSVSTAACDARDTKALIS